MRVKCNPFRVRLLRSHTHSLAYHLHHANSNTRSGARQRRRRRRFDDVGVASSSSFVSSSSWSFSSRQRARARNLHTQSSGSNSRCERANLLSFARTWPDTRCARSISWRRAIMQATRSRTLAKFVVTVVVVTIATTTNSLPKSVYHIRLKLKPNERSRLPNLPLLLLLLLRACVAIRYKGARAHKLGTAAGERFVAGCC